MLTHRMPERKRQRAEGRRKPFSAYESLVMGRKLKAIFEPEAAKRQADGARKTNAKLGRGDKDAFVNLTEASPPPVHTRDRVAKAVGMSSGRYSQGQEVLDAAEAIEAGMKLEALMEPAANERLQAGRIKGGKTKAAKAKGEVLLDDNLSSSRKESPNRELIGQAIGIGAMTYQKGKAVFTAAAQDPEQFGDL